ncbi:hypothetical protein LRP88_09716 [Fusarium phalaenopsidis]
MADLEGRLERLRQVLGQEVKMVERKKDAEKEEGVSEVELGNDRCVLDDDWSNHRPSTGQDRDHTTSVAEDLAREKMKNEAFDCSDFRAGEPVDNPAFEFCPFKIVLTYPERFIGKMNRPKAKPFFSQPLADRVWDLRSEDETSLDIRPWPTINDDDVNLYETAEKGQRAEWRDKLKLVKTGFIPKQRNSFKALFNKRNRDLMLKHTQEYLGLVGNPEGHDVVFICVDVEAIERPPNPVSEIGFAILDTRDIQGIAPGECGRGWWPKIQCHHLRVKEYAGLRNYRYVKGCPNAFNFGKSTFPTKAKTKDAILAILDPYLKGSRNIAIVGHDINQDIKYLKSLGIDIGAVTNAYPPVDTKDIHQSWTNSNNGRGLSSVLLELGIASQNLHNAGNDAYYTLCAMMGIAIEGAKSEEKSDMNKVE